MASEPHMTISCQDLLQDKYIYSGWLKKRNLLGEKQIKKISNVLSNPGRRIAKLRDKIVPWFPKYVVLCRGCLYIYKGDTDRKPQKAFSLFAYQEVLIASEVLQTEAPWAFKLVHCNPDENKAIYFSASSQHEREKWINDLKKEIAKLNASSPTRHLSNKSDRSSGSTGSAIYETDSDSGDDYTEIDLEQMRGEEDDDDDEIKETIAAMRRNGKPDLSKRKPPPIPDEVQSKPIPASRAKVPPMRASINRDVKDEPTPNRPLPSPGSKTPPSKPVVKPKPTRFGGVAVMPIATDGMPLRRANSEEAQNPPKVEMRTKASTLDTKAPPTYDDKNFSSTNDHTNLPYYYDNTNRTEANSVIEKIARDGVFLVRPSEKAESKALIVYSGSESKPKVYKINFNPVIQTDYNIVQSTVFSTLEELVEYYKTECLPNATLKLRKAYKAYNKKIWS